MEERVGHRDRGWFTDFCAGLAQRTCNKCSRREIPADRGLSAIPFGATQIASFIRMRSMPKILVIQGAGLDMRGKSQIEIFGPMTLADYNRHVETYAAELGLEVEIFQSNVEGDVITRLGNAATGIDAAVINPGGFTRGHPALATAISGARFPTIEVHISHPATRGMTSEIAPATKGSVTGFGVAGYRLALAGLRDLLSASR
jgi:3-dehydroquinate dehydratase II